VAPESIPACLEVSAWTDGGSSWASPPRAAARGRAVPPESILTTAGKDLLRNFLGLGRRSASSGTWRRPPRRAPDRDEAARQWGRSWTARRRRPRSGASRGDGRARRDEDEVVASPGRCGRGRCRSPPRAPSTPAARAATARAPSTSRPWPRSWCGLRVPVAKHGNRSASGTCGSADVLEALGVRIDAPPATVQKTLDDAGWTFLFARSSMPRPATRWAAQGDRVRTAFNLLGPLTNPARRRASGRCAKAELAPFVARCLRRLGRSTRGSSTGRARRADLTGPTAVAELDGDEVRTFAVTPEDAGLATAPLDALRGGPAGERGDRARVLSGAPGPKRDVVLLNAAAASWWRSGEEPARGRSTGRGRDRRRSGPPPPRPGEGVTRVSDRPHPHSVLDAILAKTRERVASERSSGRSLSPPGGEAGAPVRPFGAALAGRAG